MKEKKNVTVNGKNFEVPDEQLYCEKCGTTNYIYSDMKPPYKCDNCGTELDAASMEEIDIDDLQYEHDEGRYDGEI